MVIIVNSDNYEKEVIQKEKVLIDFNADWCGPCRMLAPVLEQVSNEINDTNIVSINVDENESIAREYGISSIPCLVLLENGKEIKRSVGLISKSEIEEILK